MLQYLRKLKYSLSHISSESWHWQATEMIWSKKAHGKTCPYWSVKLPLALLGLLIIVIVWGIFVAFRAMSITIAWIAGYRFKRSLIHLDDEISESDNYYAYMMRPDGSKARIAPWQVASVPVILGILFFLVFVEPFLGLSLLVSVVILLAAATIVYVLTKSWKNPLIVQARKSVSDAWDRVCPTLEVAEE